MSKRDLIRMSDEEVVAFLGECRTLQVASLNRDGTIHLVAMWFDHLDGELAFWTYGKSQKAVNLRRDPRITVMAEAGERYEELRGVTITGQARIVEDPEAIGRYGEQVYEKYWGPIADDVTRNVVRSMSAKRVVVVVEPGRVVSWDHRKLEGGY